MSTAKTHALKYAHILLKHCRNTWPPLLLLLPRPLPVVFFSNFAFFTVKSHLFPWPEQSFLLLIHQTCMSRSSNGVPIHINRISFSATSKCFLSSPENLSYYNAIIPATDKLLPTSQLSFPVALCPKSDVL